MSGKHVGRGRKKEGGGERGSGDDLRFNFMNERH